MPRHHRRKTTRWINEDCMQSAVNDICNGIETPSTAARKYGLKRTTIIYRVERKQKLEQARVNGFEAKHLPQPLLAEIFSEKQEKELMEFLNRYTYLPYDTSSTYQAARQLVYQFVKQHEIKHPKMWDIEQQAGVDWIMGFIQRNPQTNLRKPSVQSDANDLDESEDTEATIPFEAKIHKTEFPEQPEVLAVPTESICPKIVLPEPSLESDVSNTYSFSHFMDSTQQRQKPPAQTDSDDEDDILAMQLEPECDITLPAVSIKKESEHVSAQYSTKTSPRNGQRFDFPKLNSIPLQDDVFNSFGRNIAFQVRELYRLSQLEAYELMHEVQSKVSKRLTNKLRLMRKKQPNGIQTPPTLLPRVINLDEDDDVK